MVSSWPLDLLCHWLGSTWASSLLFRQPVPRPATASTKASIGCPTNWRTRTAKKLADIQLSEERNKKFKSPPRWRFFCPPSLFIFDEFQVFVFPVFAPNLFPMKFVLFSAGLFIRSKIRAVSWGWEVCFFHISDLASPQKKIAKRSLR